MTNCINFVVLSGELTWVKEKYAKSGTMYLACALKQLNLTFENGQVTSKSYDNFFFSCFDKTQWMHNKVKVGKYVTVQGYLNTYITKDKTPCYSVVAEKIDVNENTRIKR